MIDILLPILEKIGEDAGEPIMTITLSHRIPANIKDCTFEKAKDFFEDESISKVYEIDKTEYEGQKFLVEELSGAVYKIKRIQDVNDSNLIWLYC